MMWLSVFLVGVLGGITYPALAVYRTELFPDRQPQPGGRAADGARRWSAASAACS